MTPSPTPEPSAADERQINPVRGVRWELRDTVMSVCLAGAFGLLAGCGGRLLWPVGAWVSPAVAGVLAGVESLAMVFVHARRLGGGVRWALWGHVAGIWLGFWTGWTAASGVVELWPILACGVATAVFAQLSWMWLERIRRRRPPFGGNLPNCRGCGYDLRGLTERRCPECGRAFSAAELGVTEEQLAAPRRG